MLARSLTLAILLVASGPTFAADSDAPLAKELGKARPLVVIAPSSADPTLRALEQAFNDPATKAGFSERNLVLYSVAQMMGKREDKNLEQQTTMALIRELKLGASSGTRVILVGKDGERHELKVEEGNKLDPQAIFKAVDDLPASEKAVTAPEPVTAAAPEAPKSNNAKPGKPAKPSAPPKPLDD